MIITEQDPRLAEWARLRIGDVESWGYGAKTLAWVSQGTLRAVIVYNHYTGHDMAMHIASDGSRRWLTREFIRAGFGYPFRQLGCLRVTGYVPAHNEAALKFDRHLGFVDEGRMRNATPKGDLVVLGMTRAEWEQRWT